MKIAYLINGLDGGGAALPVADIAGVVRNCGHDMNVVAFMPKDGRACVRLQQANVHYDIIGETPRDIVGPALRLLSILRRTKPDLIWTSLTRATFYGQAAGAQMRIPVVSWQHNAFLKPANRRILHATAGLTMRWVADSEDVVRFSMAALGLARNNIDIWPLFMANPNQLTAKPWSGGRFRIGSLGRLHPNKGYDVLIAAMELLRARTPQLADMIDIEIAGVGPAQPVLERQVAASGTDIRFVGFRDHAYGFLSGLHAYVQPSRHEGLCIAAHEAMHAGLPVVASAVGEMRNSIVNGETGILTRRENVEELAGAIAFLASNPACAAQMGAASRARVSSLFSAERFQQSGQAFLSNVERAMTARRD